MKYLLTLFYLSLGSISFGQIDQDFDIKISENGNKYFLKTDNNKRLTISYDTITFDRNFYFAYTKKTIDIYTIKQGKKVLSRIRAIHPVSSGKKAYQILIGNDIYWTNNSLVLLKKDPKIINTFTVCGSVDNYRNEIIYKGDSVFLKATTISFERKDSQFVNSYNISEAVMKNKIQFLNKKTILEFDVNQQFKQNLGCYNFIQTTPNKKINIIYLNIDENKKVESKLLLEQVDNIYTNMESSFFSYFAPFQFQKNKLYGYYPFNNKAKYIFLNPFNDNFARFELENGKRGWLDILGKEYLDE